MTAIIKEKQQGKGINDHLCITGYMLNYIGFFFAEVDLKDPA